MPVGSVDKSLLPQHFVMKQQTSFSRRGFLRTVSGSLPTLTLISHQGGLATHDVATVSGENKFTPLNLTACFTASSTDFGPRDEAKGLNPQSARDGLIRMPSGKQTFRGVPLLLGPEDTRAKSWIVLDQKRDPWSTVSCEIALHHKAGFICLAQFCDWDPNESPPPNAGCYRAGRPATG